MTPPPLPTLPTTPPSKPPNKIQAYNPPRPIPKCDCNANPSPIQPHNMKILFKCEKMGLH